MHTIGPVLAGKSLLTFSGRPPRQATKRKYKEDSTSDSDSDRWIPRTRSKTAKANYVESEREPKPLEKSLFGVLKVQSPPEDPELEEMLARAREQDSDSESDPEPELRARLPHLLTSRQRAREINKAHANSRDQPVSVVKLKADLRKHTPYKTFTALNELVDEHEEAGERAIIAAWEHIKSPFKPIGPEQEALLRSVGLTQKNGRISSATQKEILQMVQVKTIKKQRTPQVTLIPPKRSNLKA